MLPLLPLLVSTTAITGLALAATTATATATASNDPGCIPRSSGSLGFRLVVNVTDPSKDLTPAVHGRMFGLAHIGPAQNRAIASAGGINNGPIFFQNGTSADAVFERTGVLTDGGGGDGPSRFPEALQYVTDQNDTDEEGAGVYVLAGGAGTGERLTRLTQPYSYLTILGDAAVVSNFVVCPGTIPYYGNATKFALVNWVQATRDATGTHVVVPDGCVAVNLVPQCASLEALPDGAPYTHDFVQEVRCYDDVLAVDWSKYPY
ncbi:hypothetical protein B0T26DRAFT_742064 [Lasiosphaeria miniovina]|uniref:DUF7907 domain-containing protein n=1 Tax=Lasiosphaeria miniovina TaxID=1954250 RepID=A0AA40ACP7_9PEZI|nr:uncharacterized protein B0T26DRAFT_742064 [Lasiosphaeria miniovina]KAK0713293.1 hypothetical protein B0T26DRAFT_742064 [Lasiosphaeria miniovina]